MVLCCIAIYVCVTHVLIILNQQKNTKLVEKVVLKCWYLFILLPVNAEFDIFNCYSLRVSYLVVCAWKIAIASNFHCNTKLQIYAIL